MYYESGHVGTFASKNIRMRREKKDLQLQCHSNRLYEVTTFGSVFSFFLGAESVNGYWRGVGQGILTIIPLLLQCTLESYSSRKRSRRGAERLEYLAYFRWWGHGKVTDVFRRTTAFGIFWDQPNQKNQARTRIDNPTSQVSLGISSERAIPCLRTKMMIDTCIYVHIFVKAQQLGGHGFGIV